MIYPLKTPLRNRALSTLIVFWGILFSTPSLSQDAAQLYTNYCAGCHGARMEGNSASALIKTEWAYGRTNDLLVRNISYGIAGTEMGAWKNVLTEEDIQALADLIVQAQNTPFSAIRELPGQIQTNHYVLDVEVLAEEDIETPWSIGFINSELALVTERRGTIRVLKEGSLNPEPVMDTPIPFKTRFGGFLGIAVDPAYEENGWIYLALCESTIDQRDPSAPAMTKVIRGRIQDNTWVDEQTLFQAPDSLQVAGGNRWGGRLLFDGEGYLYFSIGDLAEADASQDPHRVPGKTFRIHADGSIPADNPYVHEPGALGAIFTLGNRNTQGFALHPETGEVWSTDHGPMGGDELNILKKGANYGWPIVTYGIDYSGKTVSELTHAEGMTQPVTYWTPSIAVSSAAFIRGTQFPGWENNLLIGALAYEEVRRLVVEGEQITKQETILKGFGRVRDVKTSPDESICVLLNNPDKIVRLTIAH
ncbi:MAG: PQQ-dependent sugar dehydrogenase [Rhodothermaceae bacterium]|nr:PQQ-dependent sugar dehydrogenase [Rhodothermaceae bacterium]